MHILHVCQSVSQCMYVRGTCVVYKSTSSKLMKSGVSTVTSYVAVALSKRASTVQYLCVSWFFSTSKQFSYVQYGSITVVLTSTFLKRSFHIISSFSSDRCSATGFSTHFLDRSYISNLQNGCTHNTVRTDLFTKYLTSNLIHTIYVCTSETID